MLIHQISNQLKQNPKWLLTDTVVLAVSGGVDSMVLLEILSQINTSIEGHNKQLVVAHFDHNVREDSYLDAQFVKQKAEELGLIYFVQRWENPSMSDFEANARQARYRFFAEVARSMDTNVIVTGHHLNDQIETVLMRLIRGTSIRGIRGIQTDYQLPVKLMDEPKSINLYLIRPLLEITKEELYHYANKYQVPFHEDSTNSGTAYFRNRVRNHIVPLLEKENPNVLKNIHGLITQSAISYQAHLHDFWEEELHWLSKPNRKEWQIHVPYLEQLNPAKRCVYLMIFCEELLIPDYPQLSNEVPFLLNQMVEREQNANYSIQLGGDWVAVREYDTLFIRQGTTDHAYENGKVMLQELNRWYPLGESAKLGFFQEDKVTESMYEEAEAFLTVELARDESLNFSVRHRKAGDIMRLGSSEQPFHKKINRIMIDNKLPKSQRPLQWLLLQNDEIIWLIPDTKSLLYSPQQTDTINYVFLFQSNFD